MLSAACAVKGFTIDDELPGGGSAGSGATAGETGKAGSPSQGGSGAAAGSAAGGKMGSAGSQSEAGAMTGDAGEPSVGGEGAGGAPSSAVAPCDESNGQPPLLCDDFESGMISNARWSPPPGIAVTSDEGPHGTTQLVHLDSGPLATQLAELPLTEAGPGVTVSFWFKVMSQPPGEPILAFTDQATVAEVITLSHVEKELGWRSSTSNFFVPMTATGSVLAIGAWHCVSILLKPTSMTLRYRGQNQPAVITLVTDNESTPNVDASWQTLPAANRFVGGSPAFGGIFNGVATDMFLDDVRIAADTSSVCDF